MYFNKIREKTLNAEFNIFIGFFLIFNRVESQPLPEDFTGSWNTQPVCRAANDLRINEAVHATEIRRRNTGPGRRVRTAAETDSLGEYVARILQGLVHDDGRLGSIDPTGK